jgi:hypothetical protein
VPTLFGRNLVPNSFNEKSPLKHKCHWDVSGSYPGLFNYGRICWLRAPPAQQPFSALNPARMKVVSVDALPEQLAYVEKGIVRKFSAAGLKKVKSAKTKWGDYPVLSLTGERPDGSPVFVAWIGINSTHTTSEGLPATVSASSSFGEML